MSLSYTLPCDHCGTDVPVDTPGDDHTYNPDGFCPECGWLTIGAWNYQEWQMEVALCIPPSLAVRSEQADIGELDYWCPH